MKATNVGTRNIVEVLDAERNYFSALRDYANARFDFIESNLRLRRAAGTLNAKDLEIQCLARTGRSGKTANEVKEFEYPILHLLLAPDLSVISWLGGVVSTILHFSPIN